MTRLIYNASERWYDAARGGTGLGDRLSAYRGVPGQAGRAALSAIVTPSSSMKAASANDADGSRPESRVFAAIAVIALPIILSILPSRYQLLPKGIPFVLGLALAVPMLAAQFASNKAFWTRVEGFAAAVILPLATCFQLALLAILLRDMAKAHSNISGMTLLTTSIAIWVTNILVFALAYWQVDRGSPGGRVTGFHGRADLSFSHGDPSDNFPADWRPVFADSSRLRLTPRPRLVPPTSFP